MQKFILLVVILIFALPLFAQESAETAEAFTRADNECYEGGTMAGRCNNDVDGDGIVSQAEIDWAWNCGWYLARFNDGTFGRGDVPYWCSILLPRIINQTPAANVKCLVDDFGGFDQQWCVQVANRYMSVDDLVDGKIDGEYYIAIGANCPAGTTQSAFLMNLSSDNLRNWLYSLGFDSGDQLCII